MAEATYEQRYCAFIDILGFRQLVGSVGGGRLKYEFLRDMLAKLHDPPKPQLGLLTYALTDFRAQSISDAVAISTKPDPSGLAQMMESLAVLTIDLLREGYFMRGAIVKGLLYHDEKVVFGDALITAARMEEEVVVYPRIMVSREVVTEATQDTNLAQFTYTHLRQAADGPYYVHTLGAFQSFLERVKALPYGQDADPQELEYWATIHTKIVERFHEAVDVPRHFEKVQWFARYWNEIADFYASRYVLRIDGPGLLMEPGRFG